jgi:hypothetical protein
MPGYGKVLSFDRSMHVSLLPGIKFPPVSLMMEAAPACIVGRILSEERKNVMVWQSEGA